MPNRTLRYASLALAVLLAVALAGCALPSPVPVEDGEAAAASIANAAPGATNHLECSADIVDPVWTNLYTWTGRAPATNWSGTLGTQGYFRVRIER